MPQPAGESLERGPYPVSYFLLVAEGIVRAIRKSCQISEYDGHGRLSIPHDKDIFMHKNNSGIRSQIICVFPGVGDTALDLLFGLCLISCFDRDLLSFSTC
jgi:hypothetical protein